MNTFTISKLHKILFCFGLCAILFASAAAQVLKEHDPALDSIGIDEHLGAMLPLDVPLIDEAGKAVTLHDYFKPGRPVLLTLGYYRCPMLCNLVMNGVKDGIMGVDNLSFGKDYQVVTVSINPSETPDLAVAKKTNYMESMQRSASDPGWAFLTGPETSSKQLADAVGFRYFFVEDRKEYAHPAVAMLISPEGKITRYLYGIQYPPRDLKLALIEASEGTVGSTIDKIILYCYHYDPAAKGYVVVAGTVMKIGGILIVLIIGALIIGLSLWEKRRAGSNRWTSYLHRPYVKERLNK